MLRDVTDRLAKPQLATAETLKPPFDLVVLSCKAFDLDGAMDAMAPAIGKTTAILPLLNGMSHMDALNAKFGKGRVLGGWCAISATLNAEGDVLHLQPFHSLSFGEQDGGTSDRITAIAGALSGAKFDTLPVESIIREMWEKWVFIAAAAGVTSLMRGTAGDIVAADAQPGHEVPRRVCGGRGQERLPAERAGARAVQDDIEHARFALHGFDAPRYRGRPSH
jgi:2-dehydropantoate 2-reductase